MPFPHVTRRSRLAAACESHLEGTKNDKNNSSSPKSSPKSNQKEKLSNMSFSKSNNVSHQSSSSSSNTFFPLPPTTPTRSLLQRIQRRSSTSAESIVSTRQSIDGKNGSTKMQQAQQVKSSTPMTIKTSSTVLPQPGKSSSSTTVSAIATLPRHKRTNSLIPQKALEPISVKQITVKEVENVGLVGDFGQINQAEKLVVQRSSSITAARKVNETIVKPPNQRRHSTLFVPLANKDSPTSSRNKIETGLLTPPETLSPSSTNTGELSVEKESKLKTSNPKPNTTSDLSKEWESSILSDDATEDFNTSTGEAIAENVTSDRSTILREISENGNGLTRLAAKALEREFASQELILQGLQRDNERKTVEVEELKRQKVRLEEACSRYFGQDVWKDVIFAFSNSPKFSVIKTTTGKEEDKEKRNSSNDSKNESPENSLLSLKNENDEANRSVMIVEDLLRTLSPPRKNKNKEVQRDSSKSSVPISPILPSSTKSSSQLNEQISQPSNSRKNSSAASTTESQTLTIPKSTLVNHNQDDISLYTSTNLGESSYLTAFDTSSTFSNSLKPNRSRSSFVSSSNKSTIPMVQVRKDLLNAMLEAQKRFSAQLELDADTC